MVCIDDLLQAGVRNWVYKEEKFKLYRKHHQSRNADGRMPKHKRPRAVSRTKRSHIDDGASLFSAAPLKKIPENRQRFLLSRLRSTKNED